MLRHEPFHAVDTGPFSKSRLTGRNLLEGRMWYKFDHVTLQNSVVLFCVYRVVSLAPFQNSGPRPRQLLTPNPEPETLTVCNIHPQPSAECLSSSDVLIEACS